MRYLFPILVRNFFILMSLFYLFSLSGYSQQAFLLHLEYTDPSPPKLDDDLLKKEYSFPTAQERNKKMSSLMEDLYDEGYLAASIDSVTTDSNSTHAYVKIGKKYRWAELKSGNVEDFILSKTGYRDQFFYERPFRHREVSRVCERILEYCENHGYPFAAVHLDSLEEKEEAITAVLNLEKNRKIKIDSLAIEGDAKISMTYISNYLSIKTDDPYNESLIKQISTRIKELPFVEEIRPHQVLFTDKYTKLTLFLKDKKANGFNGVVGLLPDENTGRITITGDAKLKLHSALSRGELIDLNWRRLQTNTQDLTGLITYPFLLSSPLGTEVNFKIYRRDTIFSNVSWTLGLQFLMRGGNYVKAFVGRKNSSLLSVAGLEETTVVPDILDTRVNSYGIGLVSSKLDYRLNPRRGYAVEVSGSVGNKEIRRNANLPEQMYDTLQLKTIQYQTNLDGMFFLPIQKRSTIKFGFLGGVLNNDQVFENELFRIGGLRTLRGFDEESIFASSFGVLTVEYRFLLEQNSFLHAFWDGAWYENNARADGLLTDTPYGFGAGISFQTKAGIFSINYALGRQFDNPIQFRAAKIHFGFVSLF